MGTGEEARSGGGRSTGVLLKRLRVGQAPAPPPHSPPDIPPALSHPA
jgi:hypothetical protein